MDQSELSNLLIGAYKATDGSLQKTLITNIYFEASPLFDSNEQEKSKTIDVLLDFDRLIKFSQFLLLDSEELLTATKQYIEFFEASHPWDIPNDEKKAQNIITLINLIKTGQYKHTHQTEQKDENANNDEISPLEIFEIGPVDTDESTLLLRQNMLRRLKLNPTDLTVAELEFLYGQRLDNISNTLEISELCFGEVSPIKYAVLWTYYTNPNKYQPYFELLGVYFTKLYDANPEIFTSDEIVYGHLTNEFDNKFDTLTMYIDILSAQNSDVKYQPFAHIFLSTKFPWSFNYQDEGWEENLINEYEKFLLAFESLKKFAISTNPYIQDSLKITDTIIWEYLLKSEPWATPKEENIAHIQNKLAYQKSVEVAFRLDYVQRNAKK